MCRSILSILAILALATPAAQAEHRWEKETEMEPGGKLNLSEKDWWAAATGLKTGEQFVLIPEATGEGETVSELMIIRRDKRQKVTGQEMIVWVIDDDMDMKLTEDMQDTRGDIDSDCYVVDYGCDGTVDRMVDYIDEDGDQIADEMDIRYFVEGELRRCWMGLDLDGDGHMWDLRDYEYTGDFFASDPYDDNMIYMNKYNPEKDEWLPISECPFAFFDTDGDDHSDVVARFSAAPLDFDEHTDPDYANSEKRYQGPFYEALNRMGVLNIRYSFDIDGLASEEHPLHYEMGFNLIGSVPYRFDGMEHTQPLRRAPKTTLVVPHDRVREVAETYPATQTGFTFREYEDAALKIGDPTWPEYDRRWEGVFWTWHRRIMQNTGGPVQDWNVRREFNPNPTEKREVYYSPVDRRIHLKGATEGWLQVGHLFEKEAIGEIRMFDTDRNGYFDRWEFIDRETGLPSRVAQVPGAENIDFGNDWERLQAFYSGEVLPEAIRLNESLIATFKEALGEVENQELLTRLEGLSSDRVSPGERRYLLDLVREYYYYLFQAKARKKVEAQFAELPDQDPRSAPVIMSESTQDWDTAALLSKIDSLYSQGDYWQVTNLIKQNRERFQ